MSDNEVLINVRDVSKRFCRDLKKSLFYGVQDIGADLMGRDRSQAPLRKAEFWANQDINFELRRGECLGLIGHNGAGKTTLLKMLNGLIKPDRGTIEMKGRVGALIALGAGFNPILTGRENVFIAGSVLGLSKKEISAKYDEIVEFAELADFMDSPVQNYSSGMQVRLGFATASSLEPDILLIDEVLAVGDVGFRTKCYNRVNELRKRAAVIFVSHSMPQVGRLCDRSIVLNKGEIGFIGETNQAIDEYNRAFPDHAERHWEIDDCLKVSKVKINDIEDERMIAVNGGDSLEVTIEVEFPPEIREIEASITIHQQTLDLITHVNSRQQSGVLHVAGKTKVSITVPKLNLGSGIKPLTLVLREWDSSKLIFWASAYWDLNVTNEVYVPAPVYTEATFEAMSSNE